MLPWLWKSLPRQVHLGESGLEWRKSQLVTVESRGEKLRKKHVTAAVMRRLSEEIRQHSGPLGRFAQFVLILELL